MIFKSIFYIAIFLKLMSCANISRSVASQNIEIELYSNSINEIRAKDLLTHQINKYDLSKYAFTTKVFIQSGVIPHSHPVLTLNTRLINKPNFFLSTYLHEQLHWFFADKSKEDHVRQFVQKMKSYYPDAPVGGSNGGARNKYSTYLHLGLNLLEFDALKNFIGNRKAERVFQNKKVYKWINATVLKDYLKIRKELDSLDLVIENKDSFEVYDGLLNYDE